MDGTTDIWQGWGSVALVVSVSLAFMLIVAILVWQAFKTWQASIENKALIARDRAYETLADKSAYTQQKLLEQQERLLNEVGEMRQRVVHIEQKLAEVD
jgi:hypothetical protein